MAVTRDAKVQQSVQSYIKDQLLNVHGYPEEKVEFLDEWPEGRFEGTLDKTYVAVGFNFDDQGRAAEMGSDLIDRTYTLEFFVFGQTELWAKNVANQMKFSIDTDSNIPLKDYGEPGAPVIDALIVLGVNAQKVLAGEDPEPFQEHIWLTTARVQDIYYASLAGV
jgi:hypothetical protein